MVMQKRKVWIKCSKCKGSGVKNAKTCSSCDGEGGEHVMQEYDDGK